jgi:polysaccharide biosynthesis protein PslH
MKVLYVCHRFPYPPNRGGKIRPFNMIRHLSQRHEVTVCSLARSRSEAEAAEGIRPHCARFFVHEVNDKVQAARMVARLPTTVPSSMGYFYSPSLARRVDSLLQSERFDLIFVHCSSVAQYVARHDGTPKILDFGDMDSQKWLDYARFKPLPLALGYRLEGVKLRAAEMRLARRFDLCTATTRAEWETLQGYETGVASDWFPNGVDAGYFSPDDGAYDPRALAFVGRMDYYPNQECMFRFCRDVLPALRARDPQVTLTIVGADPSPAVRRLGEQPGVTVTGSVPDVRPYVRRAAAMVAPLNIARGTQNKILESMALGVPVVASRIAAGGVDAVPGEHLLVAQTTQEYVDAIAGVLEHPERRSALAAAGRARVRSHHDWAASMRRMDDIIARCLAQGARPAGDPRVHAHAALQEPR